VHETVLEKNEWMLEKSIHGDRQAQNKGIIDAFLDLVVEEKLETTFMAGREHVEEEAMRQILTYPNALIGLSDGGAHVQFHGGYGFSTRLLSEWVREKQAMTLEQAVRRLTFDSASMFGLYDRRIAAARHGGGHHDSTPEHRGESKVMSSHRLLQGHRLLPRAPTR